MLRSKAPPRLWDFGLKNESSILNRIPRGSQQRTTGIEIVTGETPDISEWVDFEFYDRVWFYDQKKMEMDGSGRQLARWLGVSHRVGSNLCYWLLLEKGKVIARTTVKHVVREDVLNDDVKRQIERRFDIAMEDRLSKNGFINPDMQDEDHTQADGETVPSDEDYGDMLVPETLETNEISDDVINKYLNAEWMFDVGIGSERKGRMVKKHAEGSSGEPLGRAHTNPLFDTREYIVEITDGKTENYFANVIAENVYSQIDAEGHQYQLLQEIVDHRSDGLGVSRDNGFHISKNGNRVPRPMTKGWHLLVAWKDGSTDWIKLKDIKDSYPVQIAEYAV